MKGKFGIAALIFSSITFAAPVSTPNQMSDTPIHSDRGTVSSGTCRAYQTNGTVVNLSGGETLVFYGSGGGTYGWRGDFYHQTFGGYLSTKSNYSGTAYVRLRMGGCGRIFNTPGGCSGGAIGLFAQNTDRETDFIAGAGAGAFCPSLYCNVRCTKELVSGGGWVVGGIKEIACGGDDYSYRLYILGGGSVFGGAWFNRAFTPGFYGSGYDSGGASSISAFYNSYTKNYTSFATSLTISGGGHFGRQTPTLYVCQ